MRGQLPYLAIALLIGGCASGGEFPSDGGELTGDGGGGDDGSGGDDAPAVSAVDGAPPATDAPGPPDAPPPDAPPCVEGNLQAVYPANGHCYMLFTESRDFGPAQAQCQAIGAQLVTLQDGGENTFVDSLAGGRTVFIGASDAAAEMSWAWVTTEAWVFTFWDGGEPNDDGTEDCAALKGGDGGRWIDTECGGGRDYVCER